MKKQNLLSAPWLNKKTTLTGILAVLLLLSFNSASFAQSSLNIGTSPTSEKLTLEPGEKYSGEIVVWNLANESINYIVFVRGFRQVENQPGTAIMLTEEQEARATYSAASWVTVSRERIELVPNKNEKIFYEINVPSDVTKGEYNFIITLLSETEVERMGTGTITALSAGTPVLIKVGDDFAENAELLKFDSDRNFYERPSVTFETRISNLGDTHITPVGEIILTNIFKQEVGKIVFNTNGQSILRDNVGNYETVWNYGSFLTENNRLILGPIDAKFVATYRNFQPGFAPLIAETSFWIIPWKYIVLAILLIVTFGAILKVRRNARKKNENLPK